MPRNSLAASQMGFDFDALFEPQPKMPAAVKEAVKDAVFAYRKPVGAPSEDAQSKPWADRLESIEDRTPRILEIEGIRAICTPDRWMCFYAIDPGKPFISDTEFMSGCSSRKGSSEETFVALLAERRKQYKGKPPIPATTYRLPEPREEGPQPAIGALFALQKLKTDPYNAALLIEGNGQWGDGTCSEHGKPERLKERTKDMEPEGFDIEVDAKGHGFAIIAPNGRRWPEDGSYFPTFHNIRCAVTRQARDDAETAASFFYEPISKLLEPQVPDVRHRGSNPLTTPSSPAMKSPTGPNASRTTTARLMRDPPHPDSRCSVAADVGAAACAASDAGRLISAGREAWRGSYRARCCSSS